MTKTARTGFPSLLIAVLLASFTLDCLAEDMDFSCVSHKVWGKSHVSTQFRDYDVVMQNRCPGSLYWAMCIERIDPWTGKMVENHKPSGYLEKDKKSRVNLHLNIGSDKPRFRNRFQGFYVNIAYAIEGPAEVSCHASSCEARKSDYRASIRSNEQDWKSARIKLKALIGEECPNTGWDKTTHEECKARVLEDSETNMQVYALKDKDLREKMAAIDPAHCQVWSGELTGK